MKAFFLSVFLLLLLGSNAFAQRLGNSFLRQNWMIRGTISKEDHQLKGNVKSIMECEYTFDAKGNRVKQRCTQVYFHQDGCFDKVLGYDARNNEIEQVYYYYSNQRLDSIIGEGKSEYVYDESNRLKKIICYDANSSKRVDYEETFSYNTSNLIDKCIRSRNNIPNVEMRYSYNSSGILTEEKIIIAAEETNVSFIYDSKGQLTETSFKYKDYPDKNISTKYKRNVWGDLEEMLYVYVWGTMKDSYSYEYDSSKNWTKKTKKADGVYASIVTRDILYY